jgi:hypothetical protein
MLVGVLTLLVMRPNYPLDTSFTGELKEHG